MTDVVKELREYLDSGPHTTYEPYEIADEAITALEAVIDLHVMYWDGSRQEYVCRACQHPAIWPANTCPTVQPIYEHLGEQE